MDKETALVLKYLDLYFTHPAKAHQFYMEHQEVIDVVFDERRNNGLRRIIEKAG